MLKEYAYPLNEHRDRSTLSREFQTKKTYPRITIKIKIKINLIIGAFQIKIQNNAHRKDMETLIQMYQDTLPIPKSNALIAVIIDTMVSIDITELGAN